MTLLRSFLGYPDPAYVEALERENEHLLAELAIERAGKEAVCFATKAALDDIDPKQHMFAPARLRLANAYATIVAVESARVVDKT